MTTEINRTTDPINPNKASAGQNVALRGATLAFGKPAVKPKPHIQSTNMYRGSSQALAAAAKAGSRSSSASRNLSLAHTDSRREDLRIIPQYSGGSSFHGSTRGRQEPGQRPSQLIKADSLDYLQPRKSSISRPASPSHIAATLAVSRSTSTSPSRTSKLLPLALHSMQTQPNNSPPRSPSIITLSQSRSTGEGTLDATPIPPTTSLIGMFEHATGTIDLTNQPRSTAMVVDSPLPEIKYPRPYRLQPHIAKNGPVQPERPLHFSPRGDKLAPSLPSTSPVPFDSIRIETEHDASSNASFVSVSDQISVLDQKPIPNPGYGQRTPPTSKKSSNSMTVDSFANAIVASSLASSRGASPAKSTLKIIPPPPPPTRRGNSGLFHLNHLDARTPSPARGLRQTMRKPPKDEAEEDPGMQRRGRKNIMKKHPNKHNEGDRKRWRDSVTERERKRYEAVWASNKGLFVTRDIVVSSPPPPSSDSSTNALPLENPADLVSNIVARDIWSRSRLGSDVLGEVWKLVDRNGLGRLSREEFVAGMWLIDQRLKGRKLPIRISPSVWASVGGLGGVKVKSNRGKR
jgi:hypothetical protein